MRIISCLLFLIAGPVALVAQSPSAVVVEVNGSARTVSAAELARLPQDSIRASIHGAATQLFVGPRVSAVLALAGAHLDSLRGPLLAQYLVVEARDKYRVVFGVAELVADFSKGKIILARLVDGQAMSDADGPLRIVAEGDARPARWVRQVSALRLRTAP